MEELQTLWVEIPGVDIFVMCLFGNKGIDNFLVRAVLETIGAFMFKQGKVDAQYGAERYKVDICLVTIPDGTPQKHNNGSHITTDMVVIQVMANNAT